MLIRRATADDALSARVTAVRAFVDDPVMRWLHPDDEVFLAPGGEVLRGAFDGWLGLDEVWCTDDSAGVAVWIPPGRPDIDFGPAPEGPLPPEVEALMGRYAIIGAVLAEHTPAEPHWYLQMLATHPDWQRQGIGAALMGSMFERAAAEGLPSYLETETIENVAYYRHHGFEVRSEWDVPTGPHMWGMLRPT
jgi:ribosomal protein S18 acetylase RimI-like enzyme